MRLDSNAIGSIAQPTEDDVRRAFENRQDGDIADWAGNATTLTAADGTSVSTISGPDFQGFSLACRSAAGRRICPHLFHADQVKAWFVQFHAGDRGWMAGLDWQDEPPGRLAAAVRAVSRWLHPRRRGA